MYFKTNGSSWSFDESGVLQKICDRNASVIHNTAYTSVIQSEINDHLQFKRLKPIHNREPVLSSVCTLRESRVQEELRCGRHSAIHRCLYIWMPLLSSIFYIRSVSK